MSQAAAQPLAGGPVHEPGRVGAAGMWTFLAADAMGFAGLFIAYAVLRVRSDVWSDVWPDPRAQIAFAPAAAMTFVLLTSSLTMTLASGAQGRRARVGWVLATIALGLAFLAGAAVEYRHLADQRVGFASSLGASMFYALTGYHALHVLAGVVILLPMLRSGVRRRTLQVASLYWHFVDLAWMPIFTFLYLLPSL